MAFQPQLRAAVVAATVAASTFARFVWADVCDVDADDDVAVDSPLWTEKDRAVVGELGTELSEGRPLHKELVSVPASPSLDSDACGTSKLVRSRIAETVFVAAFSARSRKSRSSSNASFDGNC
jgi:hypothetical protein